MNTESVGGQSGTLPTAHHFISYSSADGRDFAIKLATALEMGPPAFRVWLDDSELRSGNWDEQVSRAIRDCESLLFVMTPDSVEDSSVCKDEWSWALRHKKPIIPLKAHADAQLPFRLQSRHYIDFTGDFRPALARLREYLGWLRSPEGVLRVLRYRLADAERDLRREADPAGQARIQDEIAQLRQQIAEQERVARDPRAAAERTRESIERGLERDRRPEKPVSGVSTTRFVNPPPLVPPTYFQDRHPETALLADFLRDDALRLAIVAGRDGQDGDGVQAAQGAGEGCASRRPGGAPRRWNRVHEGPGRSRYHRAAHLRRPRPTPA